MILVYSHYILLIALITPNIKIYQLLEIQINVNTLTPLIASNS